MNTLLIVKLEGLRCFEVPEYEITSRKAVLLERKADLQGNAKPYTTACYLNYWQKYSVVDYHYKKHGKIDVKNLRQALSAEAIDRLVVEELGVMLHKDWILKKHEPQPKAIWNREDYVVAHFQRKYEREGGTQEACKRA